MNRTDRLMGILLELQARGTRRAEDLAATFEVSVRTIYRDVEALCETGVPVVATPGTGYRLMDGYFLPPVSFTADEAALLLLGGELVCERVDPELRRAAEDALRKLVSVLPAERRADMEQRRRGLAFAGQGAPGDDERLIRARRAIEDRRVVRLLYHAFRRPEAEPRDVEPTRLVYLRDAWYLAGYCRLRHGARIFRLDRIDHLEILGERFAEGTRHVVGPVRDRDWTQFPESRVRFDEAVIRWVREQQPYVFLREEALSDGVTFVYAIRDEADLVSWLLSWGHAVEVLEPSWLRERLVSAAEGIVNRHRVFAPMPEHYG